MGYVDSIFLSVVPLFIITVIVLSRYLLRDYDFES